MTYRRSKSCQIAEIAFSHTQVPFFARGAAVEGLDAVIRALNAKTLRLREARNNKDLADHAVAQILLIAKRS